MSVACDMAGLAGMAMPSGLRLTTSVTPSAMVCATRKVNR